MVSKKQTNQCSFSYLIKNIPLELRFDSRKNKIFEIYLLESMTKIDMKFLKQFKRLFIEDYKYWLVKPTFKTIFNVFIEF